ncbi:putative membrane protein [Burkholderia cenocepacia]|uniref:Membrane protein n=1 Tax=Burkholderia cenocepacia TaxID=95486 RepID=A0AAN0RSZ8_9BURK|nr:putative membrane protein [Burkholderia cenocepacia]
MLSSKKFFWISLILIVFFAGVSLRGAQPNITGDGLEYTLMSQAILNHGTPDITPDDYRELQSYRGDTGTNVAAVAARSSLSTSPPFFRDGSGRYYSYHFWLYSLFVVPFFFVAKLFGVATPWAFLATNMVFAVAASCAICMWNGVVREQRLLLLTLFWCCGTIPYVRWTHPEVFSASLLVISIVMALSRKFVTSAIVAALVAQQNPPVLFLVAALLLIDFYTNVTRTGSIVPSVRKMVAWLVCVALTSLSIIFFFIHFRTGSLIANSGGAKTELISIGRIWSFYFDLNQGVVVLLWPLLIIVPMMIGYAVASRRIGSVNCGLVACLVIASLMLAIPSVSTLNFNHGSSFISRYAYWASIPLLFAVVSLYVGGVGARAIVYAGVVSFVGLSLFYYKGAWPNCLYYTPVAERVMGWLPGAYNPVPEIFIERGVHVDGGVNDRNIYYYASGADVRKIVLNGKYRNIGDFSCLGGGRAQDYVTSISRAEQGWTYFNLRRGCVALFRGRGIYEVPQPIARDDTLSFDIGGNGVRYMDSGWSHQESWGTWSDAREASIVLPLKDDNVNEISLGANALVGGQHPKQVVEVSFNGIDAGSITLSAPSGNHFDIRIPEKALSGMGQSKILRLDFRFHDAVSPKELGINGDERMLAVGLISLVIR